MAVVQDSALLRAELSELSAAVQKERTGLGSAADGGALTAKAAALYASLSAKVSERKATLLSAEDSLSRLFIEPLKPGMYFSTASAEACEALFKPPGDDVVVVGATAASSSGREAALALSWIQEADAAAEEGEDSFKGLEDGIFEVPANDRAGNPVPWQPRPGTATAAAAEALCNLRHRCVQCARSLNKEVGALRQIASDLSQLQAAADLHTRLQQEASKQQAAAPAANVNKDNKEGLPQLEAGLAPAPLSSPPPPLPPAGESCKEEEEEEEEEAAAASSPAGRERGFYKKKDREAGGRKKFNDPAAVFTGLPQHVLDQLETPGFKSLREELKMSYDDGPGGFPFRQLVHQALLSEGVGPPAARPGGEPDGGESGGTGQTLLRDGIIRDSNTPLERLHEAMAGFTREGTCKHEKKRLLNPLLGSLEGRRALNALVDRFVAEFVAPHMCELMGGGETSMFYGKFCLRVQPPSDTNIGFAHCDSQYLHQPGQINFWLPLTDVESSNSLFAESAPGKGDFHPFVGGSGDAFRFYGNQCFHHTKPNDTDSTRVSIDFRVVAGSCFEADPPASRQRGFQMFTVGVDDEGYYSSCKRNAEAGGAFEPDNTYGRGIQDTPESPA